jgi:hypothetical protein
MPEKPRSPWGTLVAALGAVFVALIVARTTLHAVRVKFRDQTISVTGSARQRIRSDLVLWSCTISARATDRASAYTELTAGVTRVRAWLRSRGISESQIVVDPVTTQEQFARNQEGQPIPEQVIGYVLSQSVTIESRDVDRVTEVSRAVTDLIHQGVAVQSHAPRYIFTDLARLKIRLIADASRDARTRAENVAAQTQSRIRNLSSAQMGVIQVNAANETEVSAEGVNDTSALEKDALAVVRAVFYVD